MDLWDVNGEEFSFVMERLNNRPRKTLAFKTPRDIFDQVESKESHVLHMEVETAYHYNYNQDGKKNN